MKRLLGALDVGGTKVVAGVFDEAGEAVALDRFDVGDIRDPESVTGRMAGAIRALARGQNGTLTALGVSVPGPLTRATGVVHLSPNLGWRGYALGPKLQGALGVPARIDDDANCAALGELVRGAGRGLSDFVLVIVGSGIGAGVVVGGAVYHGAHDSAGEIGHVILGRGDGPECGCGRRGCLESLASGNAIGRRGAEVVAAGGGSGIRAVAGDGAISAEVVFAAAEAGDESARSVVLEAAGYLGSGLAVIANVLDPEAILLGGGLGTREGWYREATAEAMKCFGLRQSVASLRLVTATTGELAGLYGAAELARLASPGP